VELLHRVPLLLPFYPCPLLLHFNIILALAHAKEKISELVEQRGVFLWSAILSRPQLVRLVSGTSQTGVGLSSRSLLELLPINSGCFSFYRCDFRLSLRRRNNGVLH
jgi:hypothetical protein